MAMRRSLGASEMRFWLLDRINSTHLILAAEVSGCYSTMQWRDAIDRVQNRHPVLRASIEFDARDVWFTPSQCEIPIEHFEEACGWVSYAARQLATPFDTATKALARIAVFQANASSTIVLTVHHSVADGVAAVTIIEDIIACLNGMALPAQADAPSCETLLATGPATTGPSGRTNGALPKLNSLEQRGGRPPTIARIEFSQESTGLIRRIASQNGATVHGLLTAACVAAGRSAAIFQSDPLKIVSPIDVKRRIGLKDVVGVHLAAAVHQFTTPQAEEFWGFARQVAQEARDASTLDAIRIQASRLEQLIATNDLQTGAEILVNNRVRDLMVTNLGVVEPVPHEGKARLQKLWGPLAFSGHVGEVTAGIVTTNGFLRLCIGTRTRSVGLADALVTIIAEACKLKVSIRHQDDLLSVVLGES